MHVVHIEYIVIMPCHVAVVGTGLGRPRGRYEAVCSYPQPVCMYISLDTYDGTVARYYRYPLDPNSDSVPLDYIRSNEVGLLSDMDGCIIAHMMTGRSLGCGLGDDSQRLSCHPLLCMTSLR